jgi:hypothetical protein
MVDRGGLNYKISIKDDFTKTAKKFRNQLKLSKKEWQKFKSSQRGGRKQADALKQMADETARLAKEQKKLKGSGSGTRQEVKDTRDLVAIRLKLVRINERLIAQQKKLGRVSAATTKQAVTGQKRTRSEVKKTEGSYSRLFQTFRRIIGAYAVFAAFRFTRDQFGNLIREGLQFNDVVDKAALGIGGLIQSLGEVTLDGQNIADPAERFAAATELAKDQIFALRQESLKTQATFEQLLDTFQVAVGPGLSQGLQLDEVRTLSVQISQAASALSVPQNQLAEEIRSLLSGTIQARTTRIATALGITNENIRNWRQGGELFKRLTKELEGFAQASVAAARQTLDGVTAISKGAAQEVLGVASSPLYAEVVDALNSIFDNVLTIQDELGNIKPNPELVLSLRSIFQTLTNIIQRIRSIGSDRALEALRSVAEGIATGFEEADAATSSLIETSQELSSVFSDLDEVSGNVLGKFTKLAAVGFALQKTIGTIGAALGVVVVATDQLLEKALGVEVTFAEAFNFLKISATSVFLSIGQVINKYVVNNVEKVLIGWKAIIGQLKVEILNTRAFLNEIVGDGDEAKDLRRRAAETQRRIVAETRAAKEVQLAREKAENETYDALLALQERRGVELANKAQERSSKKVRAQKQAAIEAAGGGVEAGDTTGLGVVPRQAGDPKVDQRIEKLKLQQFVLVEQARAAKRLVGVSGELADQDAARAQALIAENRLAEAKFRSKQKEYQLDLLRLRAAVQTSTGDRKTQQEELFQITARKAQAELEILNAQREQTAEMLRQQQLIQGGNFFQGVNEGLDQWANGIQTNFQAGLQVAAQALDGFTNLVSSSIVDAFDPTKEVDINERFARLMQQIAQTIINELIRIQIAKAITGAANPLGGAPYAQGGLIPHATPQARGYASGGSVLDMRASHIPKSDTVPVWLTPGEFVMKKAAVDSIGVGTLSAMNNGNFGVTGSASAAGANTGMASGGSVKAATPAPTPSGTAPSAPTVVPAVVASERNMDKLNAGGKNAMLAFLKENSDVVRSYLQ